MRRSFASEWNALGRHNPFGAILTRHGDLARWDEAEFFATGVADAQRFVSDIRAICPTASFARALDFGCGVGRVTRALADHFDSVVGVDAAPSMVERARALNTNSRCTFLLNAAPHLRQFRDRSFSVVYSRLVLQHIQPRLVRRYIPELVRVLAPSGVLMFQLPDLVWARRPDTGAPITRLRRLKRRVPWSFVVALRVIKCRLARPDRADLMTMYGLRREEVLDLVHRAGGHVLEIRSDSSHGTNDPGYDYWVTKRS